MYDILFLIVLSALLMIISSDILVKSILSFSKQIDVSPYILTFFSISLGSSLPEIINAIVFSINKMPQIGLVTILNNLAIDFTLILGLAFLFARDQKLMKKDKKYIVAMIIIFIIFLFVILDGNLSYLDGLLLFITYPIVFLIELLYKSGKNYRKKKIANIPIKEAMYYIFLIVSSIFVMIVNADLIYFYSSILIDQLKISGRIVGFMLGFLTILPELIVTIISYFSLKRPDIAIYNLFGSFIADIALGIGMSAAIYPYSIVTYLSTIYISLLLLYISMIVSDFLLISEKFNKEVGILLMLSYLIYVLAFFRI